MRSRSECDALSSCTPKSPNRSLVPVAEGQPVICTLTFRFAFVALSSPSLSLAQQMQLSISITHVCAWCGLLCFEYKSMLQWRHKMMHSLLRVSSLPLSLAARTTSSIPKEGGGGGGGDAR